MAYTERHVNMSGKLENIIIVYDYAEINGGAAKVAIQSAIALSEHHYNVFYFAACGPVNEALQKSNVSVICLDINDINHGSRISAIKNGIWNRTVEKTFSAFLNKFSPKNSIVHIHGWAKALSSAVVKVSCNKQFKTFITLHDYFTLCPNGGFYNFKKSEICIRKPMSLSCVMCNCDKRNYVQKLWRVARQIVQDRSVRLNSDITFISISKKNESIVKSYVKSKKLYRVNNPIQLADNQIEDCSNSNIFLYVGRLSEEKGIELFCQAITEIKKDHDVEGIVVGDGILFKKLKEDYPGVKFTGWMSSSEVKELILKSRTLVFPSKWYEGSPLTIIEAMSAGLPCIVSDCTSGTEIITDRVNGLTFNANNYDALIEKLLLALDDSKIYTIQENIKKKFNSSIFSIETHVGKLIGIYDNRK